MLEGMKQAPAAEIKAEGQKLEWGSDLGQMSWHNVQQKISELNLDLAEGEKQWRLPTPEEILVALDQGEAFKVYEQGYNYYWTNEDAGDGAFAVVVETGSKNKAEYGKSQPKNIARLVRDVA